MCPSQRLRMFAKSLGQENRHNGLPPNAGDMQKGKADEGPQQLEANVMKASLTARKS